MVPACKACNSRARLTKLANPDKRWYEAYEACNSPQSKRFQFATLAKSTKLATPDGVQDSSLRRLRNLQNCIWFKLAKLDNERLKLATLMKLMAKLDNERLKLAKLTKLMAKLTKPATPYGIMKTVARLQAASLTKVPRSPSLEMDIPKPHRLLGDVNLHHTQETSQCPRHIPLPPQIAPGCTESHQSGPKMHQIAPNCTQNALK